MTTSNVFLAGHRLRLEISSSNFPRVTRNLNASGPNYNEGKPVIAHHAVHSRSAQPSRIDFSVAKQ